MSAKQKTEREKIDLMIDEKLKNDWLGDWFRIDKNVVRIDMRGIDRIEPRKLERWIKVKWENCWEKTLENKKEKNWIRDWLKRLNNVWLDGWLNNWFRTVARLL